VHVMLLVQAIHARRVPEDEADKNVNGALLGKPEPELVAAYGDAVQCACEETIQSSFSVSAQ